MTDDCDGDGEATASLSQSALLACNAEEQTQISDIQLSKSFAKGRQLHEV